MTVAKMVLIWLCGLGLIGTICLLEWGRRIRRRINRTVAQIEGLWPLADANAVESHPAAGLPEPD